MYVCRRLNLGRIRKNIDDSRSNLATYIAHDDVDKQAFVSMELVPTTGPKNSAWLAHPSAFEILSRVSCMCCMVTKAQSQGKHMGLSHNKSSRR